jgi:hypothetical protein
VAPAAVVIAEDDGTLEKPLLRSAAAGAGETRTKIRSSRPWTIVLLVGRERMKPTLWAIVLSYAVLGASLQGEESELVGAGEGGGRDTLRLGPQRVRLFGIDAPEIAQVCRAGGSEYRCGVEATKALKALIGEETVRCRRRDRDRYGRIVAVCWVGEVELGRAMVRAGWAVAIRGLEDPPWGSRSWRERRSAGFGGANSKRRKTTGANIRGTREGESGEGGSGKAARRSTGRKAALRGGGRWLSADGAAAAAAAGAKSPAAAGRRGAGGRAA